jgi:hypothetical protein
VSVSKRLGAAAARGAAFALDPLTTVVGSWLGRVEIVR